MSRRLRSEAGFSLVQASLTLGILLVAFLTLAPYVQNLTNSNRSLSDKIDMLDQKNSAMLALLKPKICECNFTTPTFDSTRPPSERSIEVERITSGCGDSTSEVARVGERAGELTVEKIELTDIDDASSEWRGNLKVHYRSRTTQKPQSLELPLRLQLDRTNPTSARVTCCAFSETSTAELNCGASEFPAEPGSSPTQPTEVWRMTGEDDPNQNVIHGCIAPQKYKEKWKKGERYDSPTSVDATCTAKPSPATDFSCWRAVTPEVLVTSGCFE